MNISLQDIIAYVLVGLVFGVFVWIAIASRKTAGKDQDSSKQ